MQKNEIRLLLATVNNNSKWIIELHVSAKTIKLLVYIKVNFCNLGLGGGFLYKITKSWVTKEKIDKLGFIKIKNFLLQIIHYIKKVKRQGAWVAQRLSVCLQLRAWSHGPGIEPHIRLPARRGACFSLSHSPCLCSLSLCLSLSNK